MERHGIVVSFSVPPDKNQVLKLFDELAMREYRRRKGARSKLILKAMQEYLDHHYPGQPQPPLFNLQRLFDPHRDRAAIAFLRNQHKLSVRKISKIVGRSIHYVYDVCEKVGAIEEPPRWPKGRRFPYETYRKAFERFMNGIPLEEAFRLG